MIKICTFIAVYFYMFKIYTRAGPVFNTWQRQIAITVCFHILKGTVVDKNCIKKVHVKGTC